MGKQNKVWFKGKKCPFYPPVPVKSGSNIPENIKYVYEYISSKRNITSRKLSEIVESNFQKLFGIWYSVEKG